jgi:plastocyanin
MNSRSIGLLAGAAVFGVMAISCGGGDSPTAPSGGGGGGNNSPIGATITITSSGVSPNSVTVPVGSRVTFVNNDSRSHQPASDTHPTHGSCPTNDDI